MSQDRKVIDQVSPSELQAVMAGTGMIEVRSMDVTGGRPVIHAMFKTPHPETGILPAAGLPFAVVMFKGAKEKAYSSIAVVMKVPSATLDLRRLYAFLNACNSQNRFVRAYIAPGGDLVLQADVHLRLATWEYVKFSFGVLAEVFAQALYDLITQPIPVEEPAPVAEEPLYAATMPVEEPMAAPVVETAAEMASVEVAPAEPASDHSTPLEVAPQAMAAEHVPAETAPAEAVAALPPETSLVMAEDGAMSVVPADWDSDSEGAETEAAEASDPVMENIAAASREETRAPEEAIA